MEWKQHAQSGHAFLSPSKYHWLNYDDEKLIQAYQNHKRAALGTRYHNLASELIKMAVRLPNSTASLNSFVNDAIGWRMDSEVMLYYSPNCYGTVDAISFSDRCLRVHDLKTGVTVASMSQLLIYAALFCLDYNVKESEIDSVILRIYQSQEISTWEPDVAEVFATADRIIEADKLLVSVAETVIHT